MPETKTDTDTKPDASATKPERTGQKNFTRGSVIEVEHGTKITRPDESTVTVTGTQYVLSQAGDYLIGDRTVTAK